MSPTSFVADAVLRERVERYLVRDPETTLPEMLGQFLIDHNETNSGYYPQIWFKV